jgi:hypothetical protein
VCCGFLLFWRYVEVAREFLNLIHYVAISNFFIEVLDNVRLEKNNAWVSDVSETYLRISDYRPAGCLRRSWALV